MKGIEKEKAKVNHFDHYISQMEAWIMSPLNMAPVYVITLQLGFIFPKICTIHMN